MTRDRVDTAWSVIFQFAICDCAALLCFGPVFFYVYFFSQLRLHSRTGESVYRVAALRSVSSRAKVIITIGIRYSWKLIFKSTPAAPVNRYLPFISPNLMCTRHRYFIIYLCVCICMRGRVQLCARPRVYGNPRHRRTNENLWVKRETYAGYRVRIYLSHTSHMRIFA